VTITGSGLFGGGNQIVQVLLAGVPAQSIVSQSNNSVIVLAADGVANSAGAVVVISNTGSVVSGQSWLYATAGAILSIQPSSGRIGTRITFNVSSVNCLADAPVSVVLNGQASLNISVLSAVSFVAVSPANTAGTSNLTVTFASGAVITAINAWTFLSSGSIDLVLPAVGRQGTRVTIYGSGLLGGGSSIVKASLAGIWVSANLYSNDTAVMLSAGDAAGPLTGSVYLVADTGAIINGSNYTYAVAGTISSISPTIGEYGTQVTIKGAGLLVGAAFISDVLLAGVSVQRIVSANDTQVVVVASASGATVGDVVVIDDNGARAYLLSAWTYGTPSVIVFVQPSSGQRGTVTTLSGLHLQGYGTSVVRVTLNGVNATIKRQSDFFVDVQANDGPTGVGDVMIVSNTGSIITLYNGWTYLNASSIDSFNPAFGALGTLITVNGSNLLGGGSSIVLASIAGIPAVVVSQSDTQVILRAGYGTTQVGAIVLVADTGANCTSSSDWAYIRAGDVYSVQPNIGQGGTVVTIAGYQLFSGGNSISSVTLAGVPVDRILSQSSSQVVSLHLS